MNEQQKQTLKTILAQFSDAEKQDLKAQMGIDLDTDIDPENMDPELSKLLIDSGVISAEPPNDAKPQLTQNSNADATCSFCGKSSAMVGTLITSPQGASICRKCIMQHQANK